MALTGEIGPSSLLCERVVLMADGLLRSCVFGLCSVGLCSISLTLTLEKCLCSS